MFVEQSGPFEAIFESGTTGLVGTVEVAVQDNDGVVVIGPTTTNITESIVAATPTGVYVWNAPAAPAVLGQYTILWSPDGTFDPDGTTVDELVVLASTTGVPPPLPEPTAGGISPGPCSGWTTVEDVAACCSADVGTMTALFDSVVDEASMLLYELSGRRFAGLCSKTVRPCGTRQCGFQVLSRGHIVDPGWGWAGTSWWWGQDWDTCGCRPLSRVLLSGYPVREITEVKIDGDLVDPDTYRLDEHRWLTRMRDPAEPDTALLWPSCQQLDLNDDQPGTFSVNYTYGQDPPLLGQSAAAQLACELYKACTGGTCALPTGTTRVSRQGVVVERLAFTAWAFRSPSVTRSTVPPGWHTGLSLVDSFLSAYNPSGLKRSPTVYSPYRRMAYARELGS